MLRVAYFVFVYLNISAAKPIALPYLVRLIRWLKWMLVACGRHLVSAACSGRNVFLVGVPHISPARTQPVPPEVPKAVGDGWRLLVPDQVTA